MSKFGISAFKESVAKSGGLSGGHLFKFSLVFPATASQFTLDLLSMREFLCKGVQLPGDDVEVTTVHHFGREIPVPGARKVGTFTASFWNSNNYQSRKMFRDWVGLLSSHKTSRRGVFETRDSAFELPNETSHNEFIATVTIEHYERRADSGSILLGIPVIGQFFDSGKVRKIATYTLDGVFPSAVGALGFSAESEEFQTYDVTFYYRSMIVNVDSTDRATVTTNETKLAVDDYGIIGDPGKRIPLTGGN